MAGYEIDEDSIRELESKIHDAVWEHRLLRDKQEIAEHYEAKGGRWRTQFTNDALSFLGLEDTHKNRNTISRDVQGSRLHTAPKKGAARERYTNIAKAIGPVDVLRPGVEGKDLRLHVECWVKMSGDPMPRHKKFTAILPYDEWWPLAEEKDYIGILDLAFADYELEEDDIEEVSGLHLEVDLI